MILGAFGDSFLFGNELQDLPEVFPLGYDFNRCSHLTYPALLAKKLELPYQCFAFPGVGNQWILNNILSCIQRNKDSVFYVINWTWIDRFDIYDKNSQDQFNRRWVTVRPSLDNHSIDKFYYKNMHSEMLDKTLSLGHIYQAICALESNSCKYIMTYMDDLIFDYRWHATENILFLQSQIKDKLDNYDSKTFIDWAKINQYKFGKYNHPLELAHEKAAEYWLPKVRTLLNTHAKEDYLHAFI